MRIICLQFNPELHKVEQNMDKARRILEGAPQDLWNAPQLPDGRPTWLLLPEMAFSGYNFSGLADVHQCLEPTKSGPSTQWAKNVATHYKWFVTVGYPEVAIDADGRPVYFNSTVTVGPSGTILAHCRKSFLYYTDETWASEGEIGDIPTGGKSGFLSTQIDGIGTVSMGICMDINPYRFLAPFNHYEFANHVLSSSSSTAIVNMAWMTRLLPEELQQYPLQPDTEQFNYWVERFFPLIRASSQNQHQNFIVACANRCGVEGNACYAGTSCVMQINGGEVKVYDVLGRLEEKCLVVDTTQVWFHLISQLS